MARRCEAVIGGYEALKNHLIDHSATLPKALANANDRAWNALREAIYGPQADRLILVRYESLTTNPFGTLAAIYEAIGEKLFAHDPEHIEPSYDMIEFDVRLGTPGLHHVRSAVRPEKRPAVLPPDLFAKFAGDAFWEDRTQIPPSVLVI